MSSAELARRFARFPVQLPLRYRTTGGEPATLAGGWTRNLSEGGACLESNERIPAATRLQVWLFTEHGSLQVQAQVVWEAQSSAQVGGILHGVAFTALTPEQVAALRRLVSTAEAGQRACPRFPVQHPITCQLPGSRAEPVVGETGNVSRGGLLLRLTLALPLGTAIAFSLSTPQGPITGEGEVVWVDQAERQTSGTPIRHGVRFTAMGWAHAWALAILLTSPHEVRLP